MRINLGIPMPLHEIARASGGRLLNDENPTIYSISTDTRELQPKDLFIAIKGENFDGETFTKEAKEMGAYVLSGCRNNTDIYRDDSIAALLSLAEYYIKNLPIILYRIGITGSVGKTTTKEFLNILLSRRYKCHISDGNHNNHIGMPMSILSAPPDTQVIIMEMGMNHVGEIRRLTNCLRPNLALITNIGTAHIGNLGSRENIAKAKLEITEGMVEGKTIVPFDEPLLTGIKNRVTFSFTNIDADYFFEAIDNEISVFRHGVFYAKSTLMLTEQHNILCMASAVTSAIETGISPCDLAEGIALISRDNTRQSVFYMKDYTFYTDFYNASLESVTAFIHEAVAYSKSEEKSLLLGDVLELGNMSRDIHFRIGMSISKNIFTNLFLVGEQSKYIAEGAIQNSFPKDRIFINPDPRTPELTARQIRENCKVGNTIFMKASRGIRLERILCCFDEQSEEK